LKILNIIPDTLSAWPVGTSITSQLIRELDWSSMALGPCGKWPQTLRSTVDLVLNCHFPMIVLWGPDLIQIYNDGYLALMGTKHPAGLGQRTQECWPEVWHINQPLYARVQKGETLTFEDQLYPITRHGFLEDAFFTLCYSPLRDQTQSIAGVVVTVFETTGRIAATKEQGRTEEARKEAEEKLSVERTRLTELFKQAPAFIATVRGPEHIFEMANLSYQQLVGDRDLIGRSVMEALPEAAEQGFVALLDKVYETGEPYVAQAARISLTRTPGEPPEDRYLDYVYQPMREANGSTSGVIALGVDVTDRRRAEQALLQSEKLAVVGRLASSIAHEINNPLESVTNLLYLARKSSDLNEVQEYLDTAERELRRVSNITNQTLRFHKQSTDPMAVLCQNLIEETLSIYQGRILNSRIQVEVCHRATQPVTCFEGEIRQVLSNLVGNAIDAMHPDGGRLLLRSREATNWKTGQRGILLTVADTGLGMGPHVVKKVFEAFLRRKVRGGMVSDCGSVAKLLIGIMAL
jgi:PAS domain S-box-containing protein